MKLQKLALSLLSILSISVAYADDSVNALQNQMHCRLKLDRLKCSKLYLLWSCLIKTTLLAVCQIPCFLFP